MIKKWKINKLGKLNLILVGLVGLSMILVLGRVLKQDDEYLNVEIQVTGQNGWQQGTVVQPPSWLVDMVKEGDREVSYSGKSLAEVIDIKSYQEGNNIVAFLKLRLLISSNKKQGTFRYKQKPLEVGSMIDVLVGNTRIYGSVTRIYSGDVTEKKEYKRVKVVLLQMPSWFADGIKVGDRVENGFEEKYVQSEVMSKNVRLSRIDRNPYGLVDIELVMKLRVDMRDGLAYFANYQPIKVGNVMYIPMDEYNLYDAQVMKIEDDN
ncbi:hypothetical protein KKD37_01015 [Patescibacteria group bacterium]|nr:hypothetical protein [Patescibacteria group bacterium]